MSKTMQNENHSTLTPDKSQEFWFLWSSHKKMDEREQLIRTKEKELFGRRKNLEYFDLARSLGPQVG